MLILSTSPLNGLKDNHAFIKTDNGRTLCPIEFTHEGKFFGKIKTPVQDIEKAVEGLKKVILEYTKGKTTLLIWSVFPTVDRLGGPGNGYSSYVVLYAE